MKPEEKEPTRKLLIDCYRQYKDDFGIERWEGYVQEFENAVENKAINKLFVAVKEGAIIGAIQLFPSAEHAYDGWDVHIDQPIIRFLAVHPTERGLGIARGLLDYVIQDVTSQHQHALYLHTTDIMAGAIKLYESYGFLRDLEHDYLKGETLIKCYKYSLSQINGQ